MLNAPATPLIGAGTAGVSATPPVSASAVDNKPPPICPLSNLSLAFSAATPAPKPANGPVMRECFPMNSPMPLGRAFNNFFLC